MSQTDAARVRALDRQGAVGQPRKEDKPDKPRTVGYQRPDMRPYFMPPVRLGQMVNYCRGNYQGHVVASPAVVTAIETRAISLGVIEPKQLMLRPLTGVRHKDDPEVQRLAMLNRDSEDGEREEFGVWWLSDAYLSPDELALLRQLSPTDIDGLKLLCECYGDEIAAARAARAAETNGSPDAVR